MMVAEAKTKADEELNKKTEAAKALSDVNSATDKAVKSGVVHRATANRKKSRHAIALNRAA